MGHKANEAAVHASAHQEGTQAAHVREVRAQRRHYEATKKNPARRLSQRLPGEGGDDEVASAAHKVMAKKVLSEGAHY